LFMGPFGSHPPNPRAFVPRASANSSGVKSSSKIPPCAARGSRGCPANSATAAALSGTVGSGPKGSLPTLMLGHSDGTGGEKLPAFQWRLEDGCES
jgi:hypothetical protein